MQFYGNQKGWERVFGVLFNRLHPGHKSGKTVMLDRRSYQLVQKLLRSFKSIGSGWHRHLRRSQARNLQCCQFVLFPDKS